MTEIELKFQIEPSHRQMLLQNFCSEDTQKTRLKAKYFDDVEHNLSKKKIAIRQRLEGQQWIQTLKAAKSAIERFEHNFNLGETEPEQVDFSIYLTDQEAQKIIESSNILSTQMKLQFVTDIERYSRDFYFEDAIIEVSLDIGKIQANRQEYDVYEIEFELKIGSIASLLKMSFEWVEKYQLWLDVRSKAEIGFLLANNQQVSPAQTEKKFIAKQKDSTDQIMRKYFAQQLQYLLPNIAAISAEVAQDSHYLEAEKALYKLSISYQFFQNWNTDLPKNRLDQLKNILQLFENLTLYKKIKSELNQLVTNSNLLFQLEQDILQIQEKINQITRSSFSVNCFLETMLFSLNNVQVNSIDFKSQLQNTLSKQYQSLQSCLIHLNQDEKLNELSSIIDQFKLSFELLIALDNLNNLEEYEKSLHAALTAMAQYRSSIRAIEYIQQSKQTAQDAFFLNWLNEKKEIYFQELIEFSSQFLLSQKLFK